MRILTVGSWDLFHAGHKALLRACEALGDVEVGVNSDRFYEEYRGYPAVNSERVRMVNVKAFNPKYRVHLNDGPGRDLILELRPDVLAIGPDWMPPKDYLGQIGMTGDELLGVCALAFVGPPRVAGLSSSELRRGF